MRVVPSPVRHLLALALLAASMGCAAAGARGSAADPLARVAIASFDRTVAAHVAAIVARDLDGLLATVTTGDSLPLIFPEGQVIHTRQQYVDFHRAWFADATWRMRMER